MSALALVFIFNFLGIAAPAYGADAIPFSKTLAASVRIERYLEAGPQITGRTEPLEELEIEGLPAIHLIFKTAIERLSVPKPDAATQMRTRHLLSLALREAENRAKLNDKLIAAVKVQADQLLEIIRWCGRDRDTLVAIFDALDLWTPENFWFMQESAKNPFFLLEHYVTIKKLIPSLSPRQLSDFTLSLRSIRPYNTIQLGLLVYCDEMTEDELTKLFKLSSERFAERQAAAHEDKINTHFWLARKDRAFAPALQILNEALLKKSAAVTSAFEHARAFTKRLANAEDRDLQLKFFELFTGDNFDWLDSKTWMPRVASLSVSPHYEVDRNVISVNFRSRADCKSNLE